MMRDEGEPDQVRAADVKPQDGAVRLCILAAYRSDDPASAGLLIAAAYAPPPPIRPAILDSSG
jgi:hypothetical protein